VSQLLTYGSHEYRVELLGYKTEAGVIEIGSEKIVKDVVLESTISTITIQCSMPEADIYVNDEKKGTGSWTGSMVPGLYKVEARREGYQTRLMSLTVGELEERTVTVPEPLPLYGRIQIQSDPIEATVYIDGVESGETPMLSKDLQVGSHDVELRKNGYNNYQTQVAVQETDVYLLRVRMVPSDYFQPVTETDEDAFQVVSAPAPIAAKPVKAPREKKPKKFFEPNNFYAGWYLYPESGIPNDMFAFYCGNNIQLGGYIDNFNIEFNCSFGMECSDRIDGYMDVGVDISGDGVVNEWDQFYYSYTFDKKQHLSLRIGYGFITSDYMRITPQAGLLFQEIGSVGYVPTYVFGFPSSDGSHVICLSLDTKFELSVFRHVSFFYTPGLNVPIIKGKVASRLDEDRAVTKALTGLFQNLGVSIYF
jgi:hypothetical protein